MTAWFNDFWSIYSTLVFTVGVHAMLALSIWLTLSCGLLSLANAAFMGIGAYASALLTLHLGWPFGAVLLAGGIAPMLVALLIGVPVLRLSGVYLAMATLAFGEVVRITILNMEITGGPEGLNGIPLATEGWHILLLLGITIYGLARLRRSKVGRAFEAIKEDEVAARLMGINVAAIVVLAFVMSSGLAGLAGLLIAPITTASVFMGLSIALKAFSAAIVGGLSSPRGCIAGGILLGCLEALIGLWRAEMREITLFLLIILVLMIKPEGLFGRKTMEKV